jgi:glycogen debranching enzyme
MSLEIKVGPPQLAIHQGHAVLLSEPDGQINWPSDKGLYFYDTRVVSSWTVYANGEPWDLLNSGTPTCLAARVFLTNRDIDTEEGPIARHTLGLVLSRHIDGGVHEDIDLTNYARTKVRFNLEIALRSDFADIFEVKSKHFVRRGHITTEWSEDKQCLTTTYRNQDFFREVAVTARNNDCPAVYANGRISFESNWHPAPAGTAVSPMISRTPSSAMRRPTNAPGAAESRRPAKGSPIGSAMCSRPRAATTPSGACSGRLPTIWPRCACPSPAPITCSSCRPPGCRGSWRCSAATA